MFNFIFEGKIGDILAPVVPTNKLFLAIQHHRNNEIQSLWDGTISDPNVLSDGTQGAIHVACRYNNRYAVDFVLSRGTNIQLLDQNGNTPLHYAAKYGHLDMCKYIVEKGSKTHLRNKQNQTSYDIAENHLVRQYLLPLVLTGEREVAEASGVPIPGADFGFSGGSAPYTTYMSAPPPPPPMAGYLAPPPPPVTHSPFPPHQSTIVPPVSAPGSTFQSISLASGQESTAPPTTVAPPKPVESRSIVPDGFHSSASDPVLQQKYGHIIEVKNIAPPPTSVSSMTSAASAGPTSYYSSGSATLAPSTGNIYSRYVAYDATTNSAVPSTYTQAQVTSNYPPAYGGPQAAPASYSVSAPSPATNYYSGSSFPPAAVPSALPVPSGVYQSTPLSSSSVAVNTAAPPATPAANGTVSRLTANRGDFVLQSSSSLTVEVPVTTYVPPVLLSTPKQKSSDSMHSIDLLTSPEGEIVNANASSNSIL